MGLEISGLHFKEATTAAPISVFTNVTYNETAKRVEFPCYVKEGIRPFSEVYNSKCPMDWSPEYMTLIEIEKFENHESWRLWMWDHWHWSLYASGFYFTAVFFGQMAMRNREPFKLCNLLVCWNLFLAVFSAVGFLRMVPEIMLSLLKYNIHASVCFLTNPNPASAFWGLLFTWSKVLEFGDTAFIVLRKQPLIFLHWYHHISVCMYTWLTYSTYDPSSRWFGAINFFVHSIMYGYYALRALKVRVPRRLALTITCLQITQMIVGVIINVHSYHVITKGWDCNRPLANIYAAMGMYASYLVLFCSFFFNAYVKKFSKKKTE